MDLRTLSADGNNSDHPADRFQGMVEDFYNEFIGLQWSVDSLFRDQNPRYMSSLISTTHIRHFCDVQLSYDISLDVEMLRSEQREILQHLDAFVDRVNQLLLQIHQFPQLRAEDLIEAVRQKTEVCSLLLQLQLVVNSATQYIDQISPGKLKV